MKQVSLTASLCSATVCYTAESSLVVSQAYEPVFTTEELRLRALLKMFPKITPSRQDLLNVGKE